MELYQNLKTVEKGIAIGKILVIEDFKIPQKEIIEDSDIDINIEKVKNAIEKAKLNTNKKINKIYKKSKETIEILEAHLLMIDDPEFITSIENLIKIEKYNSSYAVYLASNEMANLFEEMDNEYFKQRAQDIRAIGISLINILEDRKEIDFSNINKDTILIAREIMPNIAVLLDKKYIKGIAVVKAGITSHTAIIAKTMGITMISNIDETIVNDKINNKTGIISTDDSVLIIDPEEKIITEYEIKENNLNKEREFYKTYIGKESITKDGKKISIASNISLPSNIKEVLENDSDGIGLFRSEFLYMDRNSAPDIEEQKKAYIEVLEKMDKKPVIIRTMDIGGDKHINYLNIPKEDNPFLGLRAIRYSLQEKTLIKKQFRALLLASNYGNLHIMIPMIATVDELIKTKELFNEVKKELDNEKISYKKDIPFGIMIEVPSAAIISDKLAKEVDFFSIGTNDLISYTLACDRMNESVSYLYDYKNESVLRLIEMTIKNAHKNGIWVGLCGDMANYSDMVPTLVKLGIDELSVTPNNVLKTRHLIKNISID